MALPNILAKKEICPEFLQDKATVQNIVAEMTALLTDQNKVNKMIEEFETVRGNWVQQPTLSRSISVNCDKDAIEDCSKDTDTFQKTNPRIIIFMSFMVELGDPVLRQIAEPVEDVFSAETQTIIDHMKQALEEQKGIGIAAPQIGVFQADFYCGTKSRITCTI